MALSIDKTITVATKDVVFDAAYIKVTTVQGDKNKVIASYEFRTESNGVGFAWAASEFVPDMNGSNFISQAYLHLKTLPEFLNATDC
jgi:hypothetical protein